MIPILVVGEGDRWDGESGCNAIEDNLGEDSLGENDFGEDCPHEDGVVANLADPGLLRYRFWRNMQLDDIGFLVFHRTS